MIVLWHSRATDRSARGVCRVRASYTLVCRFARLFRMIESSSKNIISLLILLVVKSCSWNCSQSFMCNTAKLHLAQCLKCKDNTIPTDNLTCDDHSCHVFVHI